MKTIFISEEDVPVIPINSRVKHCLVTGFFLTNTSHRDRQDRIRRKEAADRRRAKAERRNNKRR